jgi:hypothetical protein
MTLKWCHIQSHCVIELADGLGPGASDTSTRHTQHLCTLHIGYCGTRRTSPLCHCYAGGIAARWSSTSCGGAHCCPHAGPTRCCGAGRRASRSGVGMPAAWRASSSARAQVACIQASIHVCQSFNCDQCRCTTTALAHWLTKMSLSDHEDVSVLGLGQCWGLVADDDGVECDCAT